jgi:sugar phosphate isomerase/epimerase
MKLAVSSLAWSPLQDDAARATLIRSGVTGIELAPLAYWPSAPEVAPSVLAEYRDRWASAGLSIIALQGILFEKPELQLFGSIEQQAALASHLTGIARLAAALGARLIVLGAPKNRLRGTLSEEEAIAKATPLLRRAAAVAEELGVTLCIEPNPARYGGDFVRTTAEAMHLVRSVGHPGFGLHLDAGAITINGESDEDVVEAARSARHFHVSEIDLVPVGSGTVDHARLGRLLRHAEYDGWVSIEMKRVAAEALHETLERAIAIAVEAYG